VNSGLIQVVGTILDANHREGIPVPSRFTNPNRDDLDEIPSIKALLEKGLR
jgi:hypothetical protein